MLEPRINLKTRWLAALLAFLIPGAGHFYQGRYFKGVVYSVCILGLFIAGMRMSDWKAVYVHHPRYENQAPRGKQHQLQFAAQFGVGLPSLWALVQNYRYYDESNERTELLDAPLAAPFEGTLSTFRDEQPLRVTGAIELEPGETQFGARTVRGRFVGTQADGTGIELELGGRLDLAPPIQADVGRKLTVSVVAESNAREQVTGRIEGEIPRPLWNRFAVPLDVHQERALHAALGKYFELAMVFTWVAGLLNLLAVWDALEGPAYGYGDEEDNEPESTEPAGRKLNVENKPVPESKRAAVEATA